MKNFYHEKPVAVYRTTVSIILYEVMYLAFAAGCVYVIFLLDELWGQLLLGILVVTLLWLGVDLLKYLNDRIVVTPSHLSLPNVDTRTKMGKESITAKAIIPWYKIKDIKVNFNITSTNRVNIQKKVLVILCNETIYSIDSDMYDVFFLKRKLKAFWQQFNKKH
ncbi:MAG: hypothetical protein IK010_02035 [Bacteroidales bacterium]|nr:hypothetical protein [Bacteroidales bacterium]